MSSACCSGEQWGRSDSLHADLVVEALRLRLLGLDGTRDGALALGDRCEHVGVDGLASPVHRDDASGEIAVRDAREARAADPSAELP